MVSGLLLSPARGIWVHKFGLVPCTEHLVIAACWSTSAFTILQLDVEGTELVRDYDPVIFPSMVTTVTR